MARVSISVDESYEEYFGPMTYLRVNGIGEHIQDDNGLVLWLNGTYPKAVLDILEKAFETYEPSRSN